MPDILRDSKIWAGGYDISGDLNSVTGMAGVEEKDGTAFGHLARGYLPGLQTANIEAAGYWRLALDAVLQPFGLQDEAVTIAPLTGAAGERAFFVRATQGKYDIGGEVGEVYPFELSVRGKDTPLVRGTVFYNATGVTASGNGTAYQLGTVATGQTLYAALHVLSASGSLDVTIERDSAEGFPSPLTTITFNNMSAIGSQLMVDTSEYSNDWWRAEFTVSGTFDFVVVVGII